MSSGDLVVGDADGVVVVPADMMADVLARSERRVRDEEEIMRRLRAGASTLELYGLLSCPALVAAGSA